MSRNPWFLNFLSDELKNSKGNIVNILVIFNDVKIPIEISQYFGFIVSISTVLDYSEISTSLTEALTKITPLLTGETKNVHIITYNENLIYLAACMRSALGLSGMHPLGALCFTNKLTMKTELVDNLVNYPAYCVITKKMILTEESILSALYKDLANKLNLPFVMKPDALSGSRLLKIIHSEKDFLSYFEATILVNNIENYLAEQYIDGTLFHCDTLIDVNGKMFSLVSQYNYPMHYFLEGKAVGSWLIDQESEEARKIKQVNRSVLKKFKAQKGIYHLECFIDTKGNPTFLEVAARPAGGLILKMLETCTGINLLKYDFLNLPAPESVIPQCYAGWAFIPFRDGIFQPPDISLLIADCEVEWIGKSGEEYQRSQNLAEVAGKFFLSSNNTASIKENLKKICE